MDLAIAAIATFLESLFDKIMDPGLAEVQAQGGVSGGNLGYQSSLNHLQILLYSLIPSVYTTHCDKINDMCIY